MIMLARPLPATATAVPRVDSNVARPFGRRPLSWRAIAAETAFVLGLGALCVALVALRLAVFPQTFIPRELAFAAFGAAALATLGTLLVVRPLRGR